MADQTELPYCHVMADRFAIDTGLADQIVLPYCRQMAERTAVGWRTRLFFVIQPFIGDRNAFDKGRGVTDCTAITMAD